MVAAPAGTLQLGYFPHFFLKNLAYSPVVDETPDSLAATGGILESDDSDNPPSGLHKDICSLLFGGYSLGVERHDLQLP